MRQVTIANIELVSQEPHVRLRQVREKRSIRKNRHGPDLKRVESGGELQLLCQPLVEWHADHNKWQTFTSRQRALQAPYLT